MRFQRMNIHSKKRVKNKWRKPHGIDSKQRQKLKAYGVFPDIGYRTPRKQRNLHPSGLIEALVVNEEQFSSLDPKLHCIKFSSSLGRKKRTVLEKIARDKRFKMVN